MDGTPNIVIESYISEFKRYRMLAEGASGQIPFEAQRAALDGETNSVAVIMKHVGGNLRSRWTDPFATDGEKSWRDRDSEFRDEFANQAGLELIWRTGWETLEKALATFTDEDLPRHLFIRGEPHTLALALARSLAHTAYHTGQITQLSRHHAARLGLPWKTLTVARAGSAAFNQSKGFDPARGR